MPLVQLILFVCVAFTLLPHENVHKIIVFKEKTNAKVNQLRASLFYKYVNIFGDVMLMQLHFSLAVVIYVLYNEQFKCYDRSITFMFKENEIVDISNNRIPHQ